MRRILLVIFVCLQCLMVCGCLSRTELNNTFDGFEIETTNPIPYVCYDTLVYGDADLNLSQICKDHNGELHEVYVIQNDKIWFGFGADETDEDGAMEWHIASVNISGNDFDICYSGKFGAESGADKGYQQNNNSLTSGYQTDNGYYHDGKIVLSDRLKTVEYDLQTSRATEFAEDRYGYPALAIEAEITDHFTISFSKENRQKTFDMGQGKQCSKAFAALCNLENERNWEGQSCLSGLFDKVQIIDEQAYIICRALNWHGETHAIVFQYDYETNSIKYAFHHFMGDLIGNNLYIVPTI